MCYLCYWQAKKKKKKKKKKGKQILRGGESRSVAGRQVKHILRLLWMQWRQRDSAEQHVRKQQAEKRESCDHRVGDKFNKWNAKTTYNNNYYKKV